MSDLERFDRFAGWFLIACAALIVVGIVLQLVAWLLL